MLETRKSLRDRDGLRTVYVVEMYSFDGIWFPRNSCTYYLDAIKNLQRLYKDFKERFPGRITRKMFRIAVYVRAEK